MKSPAAVYAGAMVMAVIVAAVMWKELRAERELVAELRMQLVEARAQPSTTLPAMQASVQQPAEVPEAPADERKVCAAPASPPAAVAAAAMPLQNAMNRQRQLMQDPEYRKAYLAQQRATIRQIYPDLAEALGLGDAEAAQLFDLLAETQLDLSAEFAVMAEPAQDQAGMQDRIRRQQAAQRQQDDAVRALLGDSRYALWQEYQQTRGPRIQASNMGTQLAQAGHPLTPAQQRSLTTVLIAEQQRQRDTNRNVAMNANTADPQSRLQMMEVSLRRQEESQRRVLEAAASSLDSEQLAALRQNYENQMSITRASVRVERARLEAEGSTGATSAVGGVMVPAFPVAIAP